MDGMLIVFCGNVIKVGINDLVDNYEYDVVYYDVVFCVI